MSVLTINEHHKLIDTSLPLSRCSDQYFWKVKIATSSVIMTKYRCSYDDIVGSKGNRQNAELKKYQSQISAA